MNKNLTIYLLAIIIIVLTSCKEKVEEKPFVFNGQTLHALVTKALNGDEFSKKILQGLFTFETEIKTYNNIDIDSIEINNANYYTLLFENQNPVYNLFAIIDKDLNLILKDESLNGYLKLNFKKSGSRIFAVITEDFNSKDVIQLKRISYYSMEQYSSSLVFRQFTKITTQNLQAEQLLAVISDTAIVTSIFNPASKTNKTSKDIFIYDISNDKYVSEKNLFDSLVYKEIRTLNIQTTNPQITDAESILALINGNGIEIAINQVILKETDFEILLDSTWRKVENVAISNFVKKKIEGIKYINDKIGAEISLAAIAPTDSAENYFNEVLKNQNLLNTTMRFSDKLIDSKNIYQLYEFSCKSRKILMILEAPKSTYELNKTHYEEIINSLLVKC